MQNEEMQGDEENVPGQLQADARKAEIKEIEGSIDDLKRQVIGRFQGTYPQDMVESLKSFLENGREELVKVQEKEKKLMISKDRKDVGMMIFKRSPYLQIDKEILNRQENYHPRNDNVYTRLTDEDFKTLIEMRGEYVELKKKRELLESEELARTTYNSTLDLQMRNSQQDFEAKKFRLEEVFDEIQKYEENIELIIRMKQEQVEISLLDIAPNLEQAVLIKQEVITGYNKLIKEEADKLYKNLKDSSTIEKDRKKNDWKLKVLDKEIEYLDTCINTVMQERIGRHPVFKKRDELPMLESEKIKTLDKQIAKLNDNANRRIKAINGKIMVLEKQIADKKRENEDLEQNARKKEESVKQRLEILDLSSGGGGEEVKQETENKMKIIATKRKLKDTLLQQEEEFMMLSEELNRIREKTFPSFAHVQAKYEYPDEKLS
eukprot:TRINITY_DN14566_c0_g2_i2.p1 TRINITY_DN14566_c0_g2~~TRINITY_DN14566_c0_g2_i2.p1  ORF type:complete len:435 (+),score=206.07 TRINITY_DN14566_c0_g2_i2:412-1716(+)